MKAISQILAADYSAWTDLGAKFCTTAQIPAAITIPSHTESLS